MEESRGKFPPPLDHLVDTIQMRNRKEKRKEKKRREKERDEKNERKEKMERKRKYGVSKQIGGSLVDKERGKKK